MRQAPLTEVATLEEIGETTPPDQQSEESHVQIDEEAQMSSTFSSHTLAYLRALASQEEQLCCSGADDGTKTLSVKTTSPTSADQTAEEVMVISVDLAQLNDAELTLKHTDGELPAVTATALTAALGNGKAEAEARAAAEAEALRRMEVEEKRKAQVAVARRAQAAERRRRYMAEARERTTEDLRATSGSSKSSSKSSSRNRSLNQVVDEEAERPAIEERQRMRQAVLVEQQRTQQLLRRLHEHACMQIVGALEHIDRFAVASFFMRWGSSSDSTLLRSLPASVELRHIGRSQTRCLPL